MRSSRAASSGTADLQRDLGGAIMQSIFGALLTAGFATAMSAADTAQRYPQYSSQIIAAAKSSFLDGAD